VRGRRQAVFVLEPDPDTLGVPDHRPLVAVLDMVGLPVFTAEQRRIAGLAGLAALETSGIDVASTKEGAKQGDLGLGRGMSIYRRTFHGWIL
jgi:hypothetical protein